MTAAAAAQTRATGARALPVAGPAAPPFPLVASHFAVAFGWALIGASGLVVLAPTLAHGTFLDPRVLALTHTITLGFLTTVITGVLYQIYPAMLGVSCRSIGVAWWSLAAQTLGTAVLVTGLWFGAADVLGLGWSLLFLATFGVGWNVLPLRRRAERNRQIGAYVSYGHTAFGFAMAIGAARIGDALGWWTTPRLGLLAAHFQFAAVGFAGLTAMGVGSRMLPMFLGAQTQDGWELRWIPRITLTGTVVFAAGTLSGLSLVIWAGAALMAAGTLLFLYLAQGWLDRGRVPALEPSVWFIIAALASLAAAVPIGFAALNAGLRQPGLQSAYPALVLLGWLTGLILGVSYRILPNLTWHFRFGSRMRRPDVPPMASLLTPAVGRAAALLFIAGLVLLIPSLAFGSAPLARAGAVCLLGSIAATVVHHLRMGWLHSPHAAPAPENHPALRQLR